MRIRGRVKAVGAVVLVLVLLGTGWSGLLGHAATPGSSEPAWASPKTMAIRRVSGLASAQTEPNFLSNLDCEILTYRLVADPTMRTGCFTEAAFGLMDTDSETVIFNGTDEGLPLLSYSNQEVLVPWPKALDVLALDTAATGGSYLSMYKNPLGSLQNQRNLLGLLTAKRLSVPPELPLLDTSGQKLIVNPQTLAFADSGSWLVAESLTGSFLRINLATLETKPFAHSFAATGTPAMFKSQVAISGDGHFVAINNEAAGSFRVYDVANCSAAQAGNCPAYDYRSFIQKQLPGLQYIRHVRFVNDGLVSFEATSSGSGESGSYLLAPTASITSLTGYIGLGDSYTSGEGAFDYRAGTDTSENHCHLSGVSYPLLLAQDLFGDGHSVACSGATINDVASTNAGYHGQVEHSYSYTELQQYQPSLLASVEVNYLPGYIAQHRFVQASQPRVITVSVGGDDAGFGNIVETCVLPHLSRHQSDDTCFNTYEDRVEVTKTVDRTVKRWQALFQQLHAESPLTSIFIVGYPDIISDTGNCALNVHLNQSEREFAKEMTVYLNQAMSQAAQKAGVQYVDISQALVGHRLCEAPSYDVAMNGLTAGTDAGVLGINFLGKESYHPNALGQRLIEQAILHGSHNLTAASPPSNNEDPRPRLLNKPKTSRPIVTRVPARITDKNLVARGGKIHISVAGTAHGLLPNHTYTVKTGGGQQLGTLTSDSSGSLEGDVTIPTDAAPGGTSVDVTGSNQNDDSVDITQPIYVSDGGTDADGDGTPDTVDSCPTATNSGHDSDLDGIDDVCDGFIGQPPATGSGSASGSGSGASGGSPSGVPLDASTPKAAATIDAKASLAMSGGSSGVTLVPTAREAVKLLGKPETVRAATVNRQNFPAKPHLLPATASRASPREKLPSIPWLFWSILVTIAWWLLLLGVWLVRRGPELRLSFG